MRPTTLIRCNLNDIVNPADSEIRQVIGTMIESIVFLGMQDDCTLEEFKTLLIGAIRASQASAAILQGRGEGRLLLNVG